jgi:hypothetical protein
VVSQRARETLQAIVAELQRREIDAHVTTVGCIGMCASEPLVDIEQAGGPHHLRPGETGDDPAADR